MLLLTTNKDKMSGVRPQASRAIVARQEELKAKHPNLYRAWMTGDQIRDGGTTRVEIKEFNKMHWKVNRSHSPDHIPHTPPAPGFVQACGCQSMYTAVHVAREGFCVSCSLPHRHQENKVVPLIATEEE